MDSNNMNSNNVDSKKRKYLVPTLVSALIIFSVVIAVFLNTKQIEIDKNYYVGETKWDMTKTEVKETEPNAPVAETENSLKYDNKEFLEQPCDLEYIFTSDGRLSQGYYDFNFSTQENSSSQGETQLNAEIISDEEGENALEEQEYTEFDEALAKERLAEIKSFYLQMLGEMEKIYGKPDAQYTGYRDEDSKLQALEYLDMDVSKPIAFDTRWDGVNGRYLYLSAYPNNGVVSVEYLYHSPEETGNK